MASRTLACTIGWCCKEKNCCGAEQAAERAKQAMAGAAQKAREVADSHNIKEGAKQTAGEHQTRKCCSGMSLCSTAPC